MTEQLWAIGGVVIGILATGGTNILVELAKSRHGAAEGKRTANRERCELFIAAIESEEQNVWSHYEQYGLLPGDAGHEEQTVGARTRLTELELHCPGKLHAAAVMLVDQLEGWAFGGKSIDNYRETRREFVRLFRSQL